MSAKIVPAQLNGVDKEKGVATVLLLTRLEEREISLEDFPWLKSYIDHERGGGVGERLAVVMQDDDFMFFDTGVGIIEKIEEREFMM